MSHATRALLGISTPVGALRRESPGFALGMSNLPLNITAVRGAAGSTAASLASQLSQVTLEGSRCSTESSNESSRTSVGSSDGSSSSTSTLKKFGLTGAPARRLSSLVGMRPLRSGAKSLSEATKTQPATPPPSSPSPDAEPDVLASGVGAPQLNAIHELAEEEEHTACSAAVSVEVVAEARLAWTLVIVSMEDTDALRALSCVSRGLRALCDELMGAASLLASLVPPAAPGQTRFLWDDISAAFPEGRFIAEGGYKRVFRVTPAGKQQPLAMTVLNLQALTQKGLDASLANELWICHLVDRIARSGRCPHFLTLHECFRSPAEPPSEWLLAGADTDDSSEAIAEAENISSNTSGHAGRRAPRKAAPRRRNAPEPCFQYALMQFADGGDMEEMCKQQPKGMWSDADVLSLFFQMLFSVHVAQSELELRHYDLKLLNFFLATPPETDSGGDTYLYAVRGRRFYVKQRADAPSRVMLADFGTSDIAADTMGQPIRSRHFTTLENSPPEFLLCGTAARQGFEADSWGLGLSLLHLLTGRAPYEELIDTLKCPSELQAVVVHAWGDESEGSPYYPLRDLCEDDDTASTLSDTLYRYLCLFGSAGLESLEETAVSRIVKQWLSSDAGAKRFRDDCAIYSAFDGRHKPLAEAQLRMARLPGSVQLLHGLVALDPAQRWSVARALESGIFDLLQQPDAEVQEVVASYEHYL